MKSNYILVATCLLFLSTCAYDSTPEIIDCEANPISLLVENVQPTPCGEPKGRIQVTVNNGNASAYSYSIDGSNFQSSNLFSDLKAGNYTITANSTSGCTATVTATITDETNVTLSVDTNDTGCGSNNGQIQATTSQTGYEYSIDGINFQNSGRFTGLSAGNYTVTAKNSSGCEVIEEVVLTSGISFKNTVSEIITTQCSTEENCHGASSPNITQLATLDDIQKLANRVKARVVAETMPPGDRDLTQEQIDIIRCWIDDGALDN